MGGGLSRYDGKRFVTIGTQSGLFDDIVYGIVEDRAGRFWMSSNNGIFSVERSQLEDYASGHVGRVSCVSYGEADGMRVHECNSADPAITRTRDGRIWFATLGGVSVLDPASTPLNHSQPPVTLEKVLVDHREIRIQEGIRIQPGRGELEIHYAGLSYVSPEKVQFKYRLEGFDRAWTDAGSRRVAYYTNLPPGRYHFQVTACNNDGVWNEAGTGLGFLLQPHFYQTWWFLTLLGSLVSLLTWLAYRRRLESLHALLEERTRAKEALETTNLRLEEALSDLRRAQSSMIEQERLRALGQMASGITHDFNNCLAPIQGFSEILLKRPQLLDDREKVLGYMETIHTAAKDAGRIVGRLREFYRPRERDEVLPMISLNQVVEQAISLTQPKWKGEAQARGIAIEMHTELPEIPLVPGQDSDLREVLTNLIFNAVDAMPEGGTVSLRTMPEGNQVLLTVGDTGLGMSEEVRRRCLEPFFTTKGECGTGLGLPMVYGILQRHHASVEIQSEPGKGTTFLMRFPVESDRVELASQSLVDGPIRPMRVLVVDDEPTVRTFVTCYLETDKHQVETAVDGMDGLKKLYASEFDLVITDRAMPRMSGDQLAAAVKQARPQTPVIMLTGFGELMSVQGEQPANVDLVLSKPLSIAMLRRAIARLQTPPSTSAEAA